MSDVPLNEEQEVMLALMLQAGYSERVARTAIAREPMMATTVGNALVPPLKEGCRALIAAMTAAGAALNAAIESTPGEAERLREFIERKAKP